MNYTYKVKIINLHKKSDVIVRQLHDVNTKFDSVVVLRALLIEKLGEQVPETIDFDVGYYDGQAHSKIWLISESDLKVMYKKQRNISLVKSLSGVLAAHQVLRKKLAVDTANVEEMILLVHPKGKREKKSLSQDGAPCTLTISFQVSESTYVFQS